MTIELLDLSQPGRERWHSLIAALPTDLRDIHFLPEYGDIYRLTYGQEPRLALFEGDGAAIIQPFVLRTLDGPEFARLQPPPHDIANAYGYGGPLGIGQPEAIQELALPFQRAFAELMNELGVASEFCSLHPFLTTAQQPIAEAGGLQCKLEKSVVFVDTSAGEAGVLGNLGRGTRAKIAKARRSGIAVDRVEPSPLNLERFEALYRQTMQRNQAAARWFFPTDYFTNCVKALGPERTSLFFAMAGGQLASAYFLIHDFETAYYHFGASDEAFFELRPNDLLMVETALWAARQGFARYHLGGGVSREVDDPLFRFKSNVGKGVAALYTYFRIHDHEAYQRLVTCRRQAEIATHGSESQSAFLPAYRRPFSSEPA